MPIHHVPMEPELLRNASLMLGLINIYQPIARSTLATEFGSEHGSDLETTLAFLIDRRLVRELPHDRLRATWLGQNSLWSSTLRRSRDVQRMWYLSEVERANRKDKEGEASR